MSEPSRDPLPHLPTVIAIALLAYAVSNFLHEAVGHGVACVALGGKALVLSSVHFECGDDSMSALGRRGVAAAGTIVNFIAGAVGLLAFRATDPQRRPHAAYLFWLFTTLNLLMAAGYFLFSGIGNIGDWAVVGRDSTSPLIWRPAMAVLGGALYYVFARLSGRWLARLVGADDLSMRRCWLLTVPAYVAGGLLYCISGLFNPIGPIVIAISAAAASFGGASGLLWLTKFTPNARSSAAAANLEKSNAWIAAGVVAALIFVAILGPAIHFAS